MIMDPTMTCSMCGVSFDPAEHIACRACPVQKGCLLVCCPACGFEMVDPQRSVLARLALRLVSKAGSSRISHSPVRPGQE